MTQHYPTQVATEWSGLPVQVSIGNVGDASFNEVFEQVQYTVGSALLAAGFNPDDVRDSIFGESIHEGSPIPPPSFEIFQECCPAPDGPCSCQSPQEER
jgi:hypothetical protein